ncbi:MAG: VWA domain-containing protein [Solirubrobacterales bacterium]
MTFLSIGALALLALSLPLALLHLRRRPLATVEVDSLREWRRLPAASPSGRGRFSPPPLPLLLALQLLALALLVLALAKPAGSDEGPPSVRAYVVDESLWMGAREAGGATRMEAARALLRQRLAALPDDQPIALVAAGTTAVARYEGPASGAADALAGLRAGAGPGDLDAALRLAAGLRGSAADPVLLVRAPEDPAPAVSGGAFAEAVVGERGPADLGVSASFACDPASPDRCEGLARVRNAGSAAATARLRIELRGGEALERSLRVGPGEAVPVSFPLRPGQSAEASLAGGDALAADDRAAVAVPAREGERVTLVGDRIRALPLARALAAVPGVQLRLRTPRTYRPTDPRTSDLLVLDDFLPRGGLPQAPALLLVHPPRLPGGAVAAEPLADSRLSGEAEGDPLLAGVDLAALTIDAGAAERLRLPRWARAVAWSPAGPLLAAGSRAGRRIAVLGFEPGESNLPGLPGFPALVANLAAWAGDWAPPAALAGEAVEIDAPDASAATVSGPGGERRLELRHGAATATLGKPGLYRLTLSTPDGAHSRPLAVGAGVEPLPPAPAPVDLALLAAAPSAHGAHWWPWLLAAALLVLLAAALYALRREALPGWRRASARGRLATALAGLGPVLAALALVFSLGGGAVHPATLVVDRSQSIGAGAEGSERPWLDAAGECGSRCPTVQFGAAAALTAPGGEPLPARAGAPLAGGGTDLRSALELGLARTPRGGRLALLSDGLETRGDAEAAIALARRRGIAIDPVPLASRRPDAGVTRLELPPALHAGDPFSLQLTLRSSVAAAAKVTISRDGRPIGSEPVRLRAGDNPYVFSLRAPGATGSYVFSAQVEAAGDELGGNDELGAPLRVDRAPAVLVAGAPGAPIAALLEADGIEVSSVPPGSLPTAAGEYEGVDAVVLEDVSAGELGDRRAAALARAVRDRALGLLVLGGPHSFSLGRYYSSPLEAALPAKSLVPGRLQRRRLALELVLDRSGSMLNAVNGVPKIEMAKAAAQGALRFVAGRRGELGVVVFDARPKVYIPLTLVGDGATESALKARIEGLLPEGGTDIFKGLEAGVAEIEGSKAKDRHIILLSDGVSEPGRFEQLVPKLKREKIAVATVALGNEADTDLLGEIARATGGNAYRTESPQELPRIFSKEARLNARPVEVRGEIGVEAGVSSPIVSSLLGQRLPDLADNVVTIPKPGAEVALLGEDSGGREPEPVLAQWTYGAGRVAIWTPGLDPERAGEWSARPQLFRDAARWVERGVAPPPLTPEARAGAPGELFVESREDAQQPAAGVLAGSLRTPAGRTIGLEFELRSAGEYVAATPRLAPGEYGYAVSDGVRTSRGQLAVPYPAELRPGQPEATPLGPLAAATGGQLLAPGDSGTIADRGTEPWWWVALAALLAFLAGAALALLASRRRPRLRTRHNVPLHAPRRSYLEPDRV